MRLAQTANGDVSVFGRYDKTDTSKTLNPFREDTYWNVGVEYPVLKNFKLAAVYKDTDATLARFNRRLSLPLSVALIRTPLTANQIAAYYNAKQIYTTPN